MITTHELEIDAHKLVALSFNPYAPGTPVILLHGICCSVHYWTQELISPFTKQGPCYALSLPGHFPAVFSPAFDKTELTPETIAGLLSQAIRKLVGDQLVTLVGFSTGGFAALNIAAQFPKMVKSVISIAGFAHGQWQGLLGMSQRLVRLGWPGSSFLFRSSLKLSLHIRALHRASLRFFSGNHRNILAYPYLEKMLDQYLPYAQHLDPSAMEKYFAQMPDIDITPLLSKIKAPTLVLTGDKDPIVSPVQAFHIAQQVPYANLALVKGAGHFPFFEDPPEYHRIINRWLNNHTTSPELRPHQVVAPTPDRLEWAIIS